MCKSFQLVGQFLHCKIVKSIKPLLLVLQLFCRKLPNRVGAQNEFFNPLDIPRYSYKILQHYGHFYGPTNITAKWQTHVRGKT